MNLSSSLYIECLEESSVLYEQRLGLLKNSRGAWQKIEDFENRFEPYIDALVIGEGPAIDICKQQAKEGDFGELHAAVRVFCRQDRPDLVWEILEDLDFNDPKRVKGVVDALCHELPDTWHGELIPSLLAESSNLAEVAALIAGFKRLNLHKELENVLESCDSNKNVVVATINALGRIGSKGRHDKLLSCLESEEKEIVDAAVLTLMRTGDRRILEKCTDPDEFHPSLVLAYALCGDRSSFSHLEALLAEKRENNGCFLSLGLLGHVPAIPLLLTGLEDEKTSEMASLALNLITGAELYEELFIPEELDEDLLFDEEREKLERGEPLWPPGEEPGVTTTRLSQRPEDWQVWWDGHRWDFDPDIRYRNGKPCSPACLLENLKSEKHPNFLRQLAYEELVIRYGADFPFETEMSVTDQKEAIERYTIWHANHPGGFEEGEWYFNSIGISILLANKSKRCKKSARRGTECAEEKHSL